MSILNSTHRFVVTENVLVKQYASWDRGEHVREWTVLSALPASVPDLVPQVIESGLDTDPPWLAMTVLPGEPLSGRLDGPRLDALEVALRRLWSAPVGSLPPRRFDPAYCCAEVRRRLAESARPPGVAGDAFDAALGLPPLPSSAAGQVVGHGDPNLANYLWDGVRVRVVDFEDAGSSDVAYELGTLVEHLSARELDADVFCARFADLGVDAGRLRLARLWWAAFWLHLLLPGGPAVRRNPPGTLEVQAVRLLALIG
ncbi:aminoglycoside phosphotransferase [Hamadaea flava]|uniref:Phosphotransferase family protein n=1 Tax=Hamadaea flava TaxID=1742688 RepID=A0ABV8LRZ4_9ACTN|nr:phosphotransferase [Hamadaea flava]MCP2321755.1 aminoglycoside phosphotransferase [Hamadaea flava]